MAFHKFIHSIYVKKAVTLFSATFVGQVLPFLFYPVLSRIYSPDDYSNLGVFILTVSVISIIGTLKLDHSLLIPKKEEEAFSIAKFSTISLILTSTLALGGFYFIADRSLFDSLLFFFGSLFLGLASIFIQLSNRLNFNKTISMHKVSLGAGISTLQLLFKASKSGLINGKVIGDFISILPFLYRFRNSICQSQTARWSTVLKNYKGFILVTLPHNLFNIIGNRLPVLVFAYLGLKNLSGEYENVFRLGMAPITIISQSLFLSFSSRFTELQRNNQNTLKFLQKNLLWLTSFVALPFIFASFFAPKIIPVLLGSQWENSGMYFLLLTPIMVSTVLTSPFVYIPQYFQKQTVAFILEIIINVLKTIGLIIGITISTNWAVFLFAVFGATGHLVFMVYNYNLVKKHADRV